MLDAVMLVLREVLEAALFVSLLLALGARLGLSWRWAGVAIPLGLAASWLASHFAYEVAAAFEGTGQEYLNALLYGIAILSFVVLNTLLVPSMRSAGEANRFSREANRDRTGAVPIHRPAVYTLFVLIVSCSMVREGSEIWIYLSSFAGAPAAMSAALMGGLIGTGIGLSLCALVYYAFSFLGSRHFLLAFFAMATLVVGGLSMQLAKLGLQIGLLDSRQPLWDTNAWISERSWFGQFLHALFGYDANPDTIQAVFYCTALLAVALGAGMQLLRTRKAANG